MAVIDLYSTRLKQRERQGQEDVYQYEDLPHPFRVQVDHILRGALGEWRGDGSGRVSSPSRYHMPDQYWKFIFDALCREKGQYALTRHHHDPHTQVAHYILGANTIDVLDALDLAFWVVSCWARELDEYKRREFGLTQLPDHAIEELNTRFRQHALGYQFEGNKIIRLDSTFTHSEMTKPALQLLGGVGENFRGPLEEFLKAHEKYRHSELKEAMHSASNAFESTMKAICTARGWAFDAQKHTAKDLVAILFTNGLIPQYMQNQFNGLRTLLESGPQILRNKTPGAGHGQGAVPIEPTEHAVRYAMNLAATNIIFLIESHQATTGK